MRAYPQTVGLNSFLYGVNITFLFLHVSEVVDTSTVCGGNPYSTSVLQPSLRNTSMYRGTIVFPGGENQKLLTRSVNSELGQLLVETLPQPTHVTPNESASRASRSFSPKRTYKGKPPEFKSRNLYFYLTSRSIIQQYKKHRQFSKIEMAPRKINSSLGARLYRGPFSHGLGDGRLFSLDVLAVVHRESVALGRRDRCFYARFKRLSTLKGGKSSTDID